MGQDRHTANGGTRARVKGKGSRAGRLKRSLAPLVRAAGFVSFAGLVCAVMVTGEPPLGVTLGQPSPREFVARAPFTRVNLERTRAAREQARQMTPPVFSYAPQQYEQSLQRLLAAVKEGKDAVLWRVPEKQK